MPHRLPFLVLLAAALLALADPGGARAQSGPATPVPADQLPDRCEQNDSPERPCALALDAVSGLMTFVPEGDEDYYSVNLGAPADTGLGLEVAVRGTAGLDLRTTISRAGEAVPLAVFSTPALSATLPAGLTGWILIRVENRAPGLAAGQSYRVETRWTLPPALAPAPLPAGTDAATPPAPDALENNWSPEVASPIGVGFVYDLTFACPVAGGCPGGDHDYLRVPVKRGLTYVFATFDLGPGVDTAIDVFWLDMTTPAISNDDVRAGTAFLSMVRWRAPDNGEAIVRIAPRTGGLNPVVFDQAAGRYRFAAALAESAIGLDIQRRVAEQAGDAAPTAAPAPDASEPGAGAAPEQITEGVSTGPAVIVAGTVMRDGPSDAAQELERLAADTPVELMGRASGLWVLVKPDRGLRPGWVRYAAVQALRPLGSAPAGGTGGVPAASAGDPGLAAGQGGDLAGGDTAGAGGVRRLPDLPAPAPAPAAPKAALVVPVTVAEALPEGDGSAPRPLAGVRVQLVSVFGDVLVEAVTGGAGRVTLQYDVPPGAAVRVRVPAFGVEAPVERQSPATAIAIPVAAAATGGAR